MQLGGELATATNKCSAKKCVCHEEYIYKVANITTVNTHTQYNSPSKNDLDTIPASFFLCYHRPLTEFLSVCVYNTRQWDFNA